MTQTFNLQALWARSNDGDFAETEFAQTLAAIGDVGARGPWLGGGALRRLLAGVSLTSDFDFFFADADQLGAFAEGLEKRGFRKVRETEHHMQFKGYVHAALREVDVQCIRFKFYSDPADVIDSFDFSICQFAYDGQDVVCGDYSLWDLGRKKLTLHRLTYPVSTMRRLIKYTAQGFTACGGCLASILVATASDPEMLQRLDIQYVD